MPHGRLRRAHIWIQLLSGVFPVIEISILELVHDLRINFRAPNNGNFGNWGLLAISVLTLRLFSDAYVVVKGRNDALWHRWVNWYTVRYQVDGKRGPLVNSHLLSLVLAQHLLLFIDSGATLRILVQTSYLRQMLGLIGLTCEGGFMLIVGWWSIQPIPWIHEVVRRLGGSCRRRKWEWIFTCDDVAVACVFNSWQMAFMTVVIDVVAKRCIVHP